MDSKEFSNQFTLYSSNPDDKVGQMKIKRYQDLEDMLCFEDKDDDLEGLLSSTYSNNFKNFLRQKRPV